MLDIVSGDVISFVYLAGSHPGDRRIVRVEDVVKNRSGGYISGMDLVIRQPRRYLINMMKNIDLVDDYEITTPKQNSVHFIISSTGTISLYLNSQSYLIDKNHLSYQKILDILCGPDYESKFDLLEKYTDVSKDIKQYAQQSSKIADKIQIKDGQIYYDGQVIHNCLTERIVELYRSNYPFMPMIKFLENILDNPSSRAIDELYKFLEHKQLPITSDGCFLAYKKVQDNYTDYYTGKIDNSIGANPKMKRNEVCDNFQHGCSKGLHVGSLTYARDEFHANSGRIIICKVNPRDVVSVPEDCNCQKVRVCEYWVYSELVDESKGRGLLNPLY